MKNYQSWGNIESYLIIFCFRYACSNLEGSGMMEGQCTFETGLVVFVHWDSMKYGRKDRLSICFPIFSCAYSSIIFAHLCPCHNLLKCICNHPTQCNAYLLTYQYILLQELFPQYLCHILLNSIRMQHDPMAFLALF